MNGEERFALLNELLEKHGEELFAALYEAERASREFDLNVYSVALYADGTIATRARCCFFDDDPNETDDALIVFGDFAAPDFPDEEPEPPEETVNRVFEDTFFYWCLSNGVSPWAETK